MFEQSHQHGNIRVYGFPPRFRTHASGVLGERRSAAIAKPRKINFNDSIGGRIPTDLVWLVDPRNLCGCSFTKKLVQKVFSW